MLKYFFMFHKSYIGLNSGNNQSTIGYQNSHNPHNVQAKS